MKQRARARRLKFRHPYTRYLLQACWASSAIGWGAEAVPQIVGYARADAARALAIVAAEVGAVAVSEVVFDIHQSPPLGSVVTAVQNFVRQQRCWPQNGFPADIGGKRIPISQAAEIIRVATTSSRNSA